MANSWRRRVPGTVFPEDDAKAFLVDLYTHHSQAMHRQVTEKKAAGCPLTEDESAWSCTHEVSGSIRHPESDRKLSEFINACASYAIDPKGYGMQPTLQREQREYRENLCQHTRLDPAVILTSADYILAQMEQFASRLPKVKVRYSPHQLGDIKNNLLVEAQLFFPELSDTTNQQKLLENYLWRNILRTVGDPRYERHQLADAAQDVRNELIGQGSNLPQCDRVMRNMDRLVYNHVKRVLPALPDRPAGRTT